jgi:hypothetical protein
MADNRLVYSLLAVLTGPVGGAVAGYAFARNRQRLTELGSDEPQHWRSPLFNALIGAVLFPPIPGLIFAWNCGEQEMKINQLETARDVSGLPGGVLPLHHTAIEPGRSQWQDRVANATAPAQIER